VGTSACLFHIWEVSSRGALSVYSSRPSVWGNSVIVVLGGTTRRRSLKPEGPKIEAEGRGRGRVLGFGTESLKIIKI